MKSDKGRLFVNDWRLDRRLIVALVILFLIIVGLIIGMLILIMNDRNFEKVDDVDDVIEVDQGSCVVNSDFFDAESCLGQISTEVSKMCADTEEYSCYTNALDYIESWVSRVESEVTFRNDLMIYRVEFCVNNLEPMDAIVFAQTIDEESLSQLQKYHLYRYLSSAYYQVDDDEMGLEYFNLSMENLPESVVETGLGDGE